MPYEIVGELVVFYKNGQNPKPNLVIRKSDIKILELKDLNQAIRSREYAMTGKITHPPDYKTMIITPYETFEVDDNLMDHLIRELK